MVVQRSKLKIAVLVATYNGELYIKQQLDSILHQKDVSDYDFEVFVYDDGSTDDTLNILKQYGESIHLIPKDPEFQGVKSAIYTLLSYVKADYYYFSDQDDVWEPNKVQQTQKSLRDLRNGIPGGVYSDLLLTDAQNDTKNETMMGINGWSIDEKRSLSFLILNSRVTGAAFAINREARDFALKLPKKDFLAVSMHDAFLALTIAAFDNLTFLPKPLVRYRQHGNNQIGAKRTFSQRINVFQRVKSLKKRLNDLIVLEKLAPFFPVDVQEELKVFKDFTIHKDPFYRICLLAKNRKYWQDTSILKLLIIVVSCTSVGEIK